MTADELFRLPDDGYRYELVRGELRKMSPAGGDHCAIAARIVVSLGSHVYAKKLGQIYTADPGFYIEHAPDTVRAPDVAYVRSERVVKTSRFIEGAPDLAIEVISPGNTRKEMDRKLQEYFAAGTTLVWYIDPRTRSAVAM